MYLYKEMEMTAHGNTVIVYTQEQFEKLLAHPASISGWFDPSQSTGVVQFPTPSAAVAARREA